MHHGSGSTPIGYIYSMWSQTLFSAECVGTLKSKVNGKRDHSSLHHDLKFAIMTLDSNEVVGVNKV